MIVDARPIHSDLVPEPVEWAGPRACREAHFHSNKDSIVYPFFMRIICHIKPM